MYLAFLACRPSCSDVSPHRWAPGPSAWLACVAGLTLPVCSLAAGGHHAVDDAAILDPGHCQVETWIERSGWHQLGHIGSSCHALGTELGINLERNAPSAETAVRSFGIQLKWARELQLDLSIGVTWSGIWQSGSPRFAGHTLLLPLSWSPREDLALHLNIGRDMPAQGAGLALYGAAAEWRSASHWEALAEWWRDGLGTKGRIGLRYVVDEHLSLDISRARSANAAQGLWWTLGVNWALAR